MNKFKPHAEYDALLKQALALNRLNNSLESQIEFYRNQDYSARIDRLNELNTNLDSEKAMNETLTNENQDLQQQLATTQLENQKLRDALECLDKMGVICNRETNQSQKDLATYKARMILLSTSPNTDALKQYVDAEIARRIGVPVAWMLTGNVGCKIYKDYEEANKWAALDGIKGKVDITTLYTLKD